MMRPCGSGVRFEGLAEGERQFLVRALDRRGNPGPVVYWTWKANAGPPETTLTAAPPLQDRQTVTRFELHTTERSRFACTLDGVPLVISFAPCGPVVTVSVGPGEHVFTAQAIDLLGGADPTPVVYRWTVDLDAPDTRIDAGPPPTTAARSADLSFSSTDPAAGFECRTDGAAWTSCTSPHHIDGVVAGVHDFQVRAVDPAGNRDAAGAARVWRVEEPSVPGVRPAAAPHHLDRSSAAPGRRATYGAPAAADPQRRRPAGHCPSLRQLSAWLARIHARKEPARLPAPGDRRRRRHHIRASRPPAAPAAHGHAALQRRLSRARDAVRHGPLDRAALRAIPYRILRRAPALARAVPSCHRPDLTFGGGPGHRVTSVADAYGSRLACPCRAHRRCGGRRACPFGRSGAPPSRQRGGTPDPATSQQPEVTRDLESGEWVP